MSYKLTIINTHWAFMKEPESELESESESEVLCIDYTDPDHKRNLYSRDILTP
jgi:hypothetical protein